MNPIVKLAKETSLYTDQVDWNSVNSEFIKLTQGATEREDLIPGLQYLINSIEDKHAQIRRTDNHQLLAYYTGPSEDGDNRDGEFINSVINDISAEFSYQLLDDQVGYLRVVGIGPGDVKEQSDFIRNGLVQLKNDGVDSWILDLRYNGGGNIEPMLSGLAPLLGDGIIGGAVNNRGELNREYSIDQGRFNNDGRIVCEMDENPRIDQSEKVVVLLSRYTVSSGELVAVAFKGRQNTRFIGEPTGGYTTGNGYDPITDDIALIISQDVFADRNGQVYKDQVDVDEFIEFQHNKEIKGDRHIERAMEWLKK